MKNEIQLEQILELLPAYICLHYVDYDDNLNARIDLLQSCVMENSQDNLYEYVDNAFMDSEAGAVRQYMKELQDNVSGKFGLDEKKAHQLVFETYGDNIRELLYERNDSSPVDDLLKNTRAFSIFIDTGMEIDADSWSWTGSEKTVCLNKIKRKIRINTSEHNVAHNDLLLIYGCKDNHSGCNPEIYFIKSGMVSSNSKCN